MTKELIIQTLELLLAGGYINKDDLVPILKQGFVKWLDAPEQDKLKVEINKKDK